MEEDMPKTKQPYRVVYGESRPAWEQKFPTKKQAEAFARKQKRLGDVIFSVKQVVPGEPPQSLTAAIEQARS
jgi:hypothetical protein